MKTISGLFLGLMILSTGARAAPIEMSRILRDQTTSVALDLNDKTVFCTDRGYGNVQLKISVPDLDWLASLDHRVAGERLPCITGGRCTAQNTPEMILEGGRVEVTRLRVILTERILLDAQARTCRSTLEESVAGVIRGRKFNHLRNSPTRDVDFELCEALVKQPRRGARAPIDRR